MAEGPTRAPSPFLSSSAQPPTATRPRPRPHVPSPFFLAVAVHGAPHVSLLHFFFVVTEPVSPIPPNRSLDTLRIYLSRRSFLTPKELRDPLPDVIPYLIRTKATLAWFWILPMCQAHPSPRRILLAVILMIPSCCRASPRGCKSPPTSTLFSPST